MRESPPLQALRQTSSLDFVRSIGVPITFAASALFTTANPPQIHAQESSPPRAVAEEYPSAPQIAEREILKETFDKFSGELEVHIRLLDDPEFATREKAHRKIIEQSKVFFRTVHPLPMHLEARWRALMDFRFPRYTLEQRMRLKYIDGALQDHDLFRVTRIPVAPEATPAEILQTLQKQIGVKLRFPPDWNDFKKIIDRMKAQKQGSVSFAPLLLQICKEGNFVPVLEPDGITIAFQENSAKANVFLHEDDMLCVLETAHDIPTAGERLRIFPDPQQQIASLEHATVMHEPSILVDVCPAGLRQWGNDPALSPRKMRLLGTPGCFEVGEQPKNGRAICLTAAVMRDRRTWEVSLDGTRNEKGIQAVSALCEKGSKSISIHWRSTDPDDSPQVCWSEMPVAGNQYEAIDREGNPIETTSSPITYEPNGHSFSVQLECAKAPHRLRIRGYAYLSPYHTGGECIVVGLPSNGSHKKDPPKELPVPPLPEPPDIP